LLDLRVGFASAYASLDAAMQGIADTSFTPEQIAELYANTDASQYAFVDQLIASHTAGQIAKGTYTQVKDAFDALSAIDTLNDSIASVSAALDELSEKISGSSPAAGQFEQLSAGLSELNRNYVVFHGGLNDYMKGVGALSSGYADFHNGLSSFTTGVGGIYTGVDELHEGTTRLNDEAAKIPVEAQTEINGILDKYTGTDFSPMSFTSQKNEHTDLVQFVLKCDGIEKEETKGAISAPVEETLWSRIKALFR
jgi:uncharacterized phage infection (PIP) family protein YhgE